MDITSLPFNQLVGIQRADLGSGYILSLPADTKYHNHLGTVHASALLSLAEATSGEFLITRLGGTDGLIPVVRRLEAKFKKPGFGKLFSRVTTSDEAITKLLEEFNRKGRALIEVSVDVVSADDTVLLSANIEWFIVKQKL
jgi:acyl-coenzyme A thioesterase PaaI-like protein